MQDIETKGVNYVGANEMKGDEGTNWNQKGIKMTRTRIDTNKNCASLLHEHHK